MAPLHRKIKEHRLAKKKKTESKRRRRTAEEAKEHILEAAEKRVMQVGPDGLRLQDLAADVGISHPAILHHFGGRSELLRAVVDRILARLQVELVALYASEEEFDAEGVVARVVELLESGYGRLLAWLQLTDQADALGISFDVRSRIQIMTEASHARRLRLYGESGLPPPPLEETWFAMIAMGETFFGEALYGRAMRGDDPELTVRYRNWLARLFKNYLEGKLRLVED